MKNSKLTGVLEIIDPPKGFKPWHGGPTLTGALRGVDNKEAAWKPAPDRHSIWELALHIAYWNYRVRCHINPDKKIEFDRYPADWPVIEDSSKAAWKTDKGFIKQEHKKLVQAVKTVPAERLDQHFAKSKKWIFRQLLEGIAGHETYHIAQIQLMKRLYVDLN